MEPLPARPRPVGAGGISRLSHAIHPGRLATLAALLRAIAAMLARRRIIPNRSTGVGNCTTASPLPYYLRADLWEVLDETGQRRSGPRPSVDRGTAGRQLSLADRVAFGGCRLTVRRGLEFWPLLGDADPGARPFSVGGCQQHAAGNQPARRSRFGTEHPDPADWQLTVNGYRLPLRREGEMDGETRVRAALPPLQTLDRPASHPGSAGPIELLLSHPRQPDALRLTLHEWRPQGGGYDGLPGIWRKRHSAGPNAS